jgi:hypothetical protein
MKTTILPLLGGLLLSREPLYGIGEWAAQHAPHLLGLTAAELGRLNDDRMGRALDRLFLADVPSLALPAGRAPSEVAFAADPLSAADDRKTLLATEDRLCRGAGVPQAGATDPRAAVHVLLCPAGGDARGTPVASSDGARGDRVAADVSRGPACPARGRNDARRPGPLRSTGTTSARCPAA